MKKDFYGKALTLTRWPSYTNFTRMSWRSTRWAKINLLHQGFQKSLSDSKQRDTTVIITAAALWIVFLFSYYFFILFIHNVQLANKENTKKIQKRNKYSYNKYTTQWFCNYRHLHLSKAYLGQYAPCGLYAQKISNPKRDTMLCEVPSEFLQSVLSGCVSKVSRIVTELIVGQMLQQKYGTVILVVWNLRNVFIVILLLFF